MAKLKEEEIIDRWSVLIGEAKGRGKEIFRLTKENLEVLKVPKIKLAQKEISPTWLRKLKGQTRTFLVVENTYLEGYLMYVGALDYGEQMFVSWYLTLEATGLARLLAKLPWWLQIPFFPLLIPIAVYNLFKRKI